MGVKVGGLKHWDFLFAWFFLGGFLGTCSEEAESWRPQKPCPSFLLWQMMGICGDLPFRWDVVGDVLGLLKEQTNHSNP